MYTYQYAFVLQVNMGPLCFMIDFFHLQVHEHLSISLNTFLSLNFSERAMCSPPEYVNGSQDKEYSMLIRETYISLEDLKPTRFCNKASFFKALPLHT